MKIDGLTSNDLFVLLVLAAEGRAMSSTDLKKVGPDPTTDVRRRLEERGLISVDRAVRPFLHSIDDDGWDVVADLSETTPEVQSNPAARTLWTVLQVIGRNLARTETGVADFFTPASEVSDPAPETTDSESEPVVTANQPEQAATKVRAAYQRTADAPGAVVWLSDLRTAVGLSGTEFDAVILTLSREHDIEVLPEDNRKALPDHARAGAVTIGGQDAHYIRIR